MKLHPLARSLVIARPWPFLIDVGVASCGLAIFFSLVSTGKYWMGQPVPVVPISHSISALPVYAFFSIVRIAIAYVLSLTSNPFGASRGGFSSRCTATHVRVRTNTTVTANIVCTVRFSPSGPPAG